MQHAICRNMNLVNNNECWGNKSFFSYYCCTFVELNKKIVMSTVAYKQYVVSCRTKEVVCGERTFRYGVGEILRTPYPLTPPQPSEHDFRTCQVCQQNRIKLIESLRDRYNRFPDCCEFHKNLRRLKVFNKGDYKNAHVQCADSVIFCYDFILNHQNTNNWQEYIKKYLYRAVYRFGCMPKGYGSALFLDTFDIELRSHVATNNDIRPEVKWYVNKILDEYITHSSSTEKDPIEQLLHIYNNWLNAFPFDLPEFCTWKEKFAIHSPIRLLPVRGDSSVQIYRLPTNEELVKWLTKQSKELFGLFKQMRNSSAFSQAMYLDYERSMKTKQLDIKEARLLDNYLYEEEEYLKTLAEWFDIQIERIELLCAPLPKQGGFEEDNSYKEAHRRINNFKIWIEDQNGYKILFPEKNLNEDYLQILFKGTNTIAGSSYRFDREGGKGRGNADFIVSKGAADGTIVEFKMASNTDLASNLMYQVPVYKKSNQIDNAITVIFYFSDEELQRVKNILEKQNRQDDEDVVLIDCSGNKPSASKVRREEDV